MGTLIDTSVLIAAERGQIDLATVAGDEADATAIAAISASELLHGIYRLPHAVTRTRVERFVERLLQTITIVPFDLDIARVQARLGAELAMKGATIGAHDLMIAATAAWLDYRIATRDLRSFPKVRGLDVVRW